MSRERVGETCKAPIYLGVYYSSKACGFARSKFHPRPWYQLEWLGDSPLAPSDCIWRVPAITDKGD